MTTDSNNDIENIKSSVVQLNSLEKYEPYQIDINAYYHIDGTKLSYTYFIRLILSYTYRLELFTSNSVINSFIGGRCPTADRMKRLLVQ